MKVLFKHELKDHGKEIIILSMINIALCLIFGIYLRFIMIKSSGEDSLIGLFGFLFIAIFIAISVVLVVSIIKSFNTKLFSNEGYLTFVLPVSLDKLLIVKYLVNLLWVVVVILSYIIGVICLIIIVEDLSATDTFELFKELGELIINDSITLLLSIIKFIVDIAYILSALFATLAILNCGKIKKAKFIMGLFIFWGINFIVKIINMIFTGISVVIGKVNNQLTIGLINDFTEKSTVPERFIEVFNINLVVITGLFVVGLYFIARFIINHKLELE